MGIFKISYIFDRKITMRHQAAYSLLYIGGNSAPTQAQVEAFMKECGVSCDKATLTTFFAQIKDKSVTDLVAAGHKKHVKMPTGGGGGAPAAKGGAAAAEVVRLGSPSRKAMAH